MAESESSQMKLNLATITTGVIQFFDFFAENSFLSAFVDVKMFNKSIGCEIFFGATAANATDSSSRESISIRFQIFK